MIFLSGFANRGFPIRLVGLVGARPTNTGIHPGDAPMQPCSIPINKNMSPINTIKYLLYVKPEAVFLVRCNHSMRKV
jgi:hypothetical protein